jgi:hypothetical protein
MFIQQTTTPSTNLDTTATTTTQSTAPTSLPANDPYTFEATFDYRPTATTSHSEGRAAHEGSDADLGRFGVTYSVPQDVGESTVDSPFYSAILQFSPQDPTT